MLSQTVKHSLGCKILADSWHTITNHLFFDDYSLQPYHRQWHYWYISGTQLFLSTDASFQYLVKRLLARPLMCQAEQSCSLPVTGPDDGVVDEVVEWVNSWWSCWIVRQSVAVHWPRDHRWGCWLIRQSVAVHSQSLVYRLLACQAERSCSLPVTGPETVDEAFDTSGRV